VTTAAVEQLTAAAVTGEWTTAAVEQLTAAAVTGE